MLTISDLPKIRGDYRFDAKLPNWFGVGGNAEVLFRPVDIEDLKFFLENINRQISFQILGAGSNVIISDEGVKGVVIRAGKEFAKISHFQKNNKFFIRAGCASLCASVASYAKDFGLTGLEFLSGIPGSIGGAIAMNAGCYGSEISQIINNITALDYQGVEHNLIRPNIEFAYRYNPLAKNFIFVEGCFEVLQTSVDEVAKKILEIQKQRELSQPIRAKTSGSTFKNPPQKKAWELIDAIGYRGKIKGGAKFSEKHCNFLINFNNASAQDLIDLGAEAKQQVMKKFSINLEWEIKIIK